MQHRERLSEDDFEAILLWVEHMDEQQLLRLRCKLDVVEPKQERFEPPDPYQEVFERDTQEILVPVSFDEDEPTES